MGTIKATNIEPIADNGTITLGSSGDIFALGSGTKASFLYPAFEAKLSGDFTLTEGVNTKVTFQTENFDTDNLYDNSTNYRFTPNVSGKYFVYTDLNCDTTQTNSFRQGTVWIYKNGAAVKQGELLFNTNFARRCNVGVSGIVEMNGSSDYLEIFVNVVNGIDTPAQLNHQGGLTNYFGAYRIGT
jgi:hypothetical protein